MNFFSIRWKISISFVIFALGFVGIYVVIATRVFKSDKLSYVFETQQKQVESVVQNFANLVERAVIGSRAVVLGFDSATRKVQPAAERFFREEKAILAIELNQSGAAQPLFVLEKTAGQLQEVGDLGKVADGQPGVEILHWKDSVFLLTITDFNRDQEPVRTRVLLQMDGLLDDALDGQTLLLSQKSKVTLASEPAVVPIEEVEGMLNQSASGFPDGTTIFELNGEKQLVSMASTPLSGYSVIGILSETNAMSALQTFYRRSVFFVLFSAFATVFISLILSYGLTRNINGLTVAAERLGQGDFSSVPETSSRDEVGVLTKAFQRMVQEIQRLLKDTADKARMEQELKTARLVQESLFPDKQNTQIKNMSLSGFYATSSECGGDWWYYYITGDEIVVAVADATGHGTPAALVTSAARSLFSYLEHQNLSLKEIATHWNEAIAVCSKQKVFMTAILARINAVTGVGTFINAGHEPPLFLTRVNQKYTSEFLMSPQNPTLGERGTTRWTETHFQVVPGSRLLIYTDGLLAFKSPEGATVGERRFMKAVEKLAVQFGITREFVEGIFKHFDKFGGNQTLPDDVTFVVVENNSTTS